MAGVLSRPIYGVVTTVLGAAALLLSCQAPPRPAPFREQFAYELVSATYTVGEQITPNRPVGLEYEASRFAVTPDLPSGLVLDSIDGVVSGVPTEVSTRRDYRVAAFLEDHICSATVSIEVVDSLSSPRIVVGPQTQHVVAGDSAVFEATVIGNPVPACQWFRNDTAIAGETGERLVLRDVTMDDSGVVLYCRASNTKATVATAACTLVVTMAPVGPSVAVVPDSGTTYEGDSVRFSAVVSSGTQPIHFEWRKDGENYSSLDVASINIPNLALADSGTYTVKAWNVVDSAFASAELRVLPKYHDIAVSIQGSGRVEPVPADGAIKVRHGADQTLLLTHDAGWHLDSVLLEGIADSTALATSRLIIDSVVSDLRVRVVFSQTAYVLTIEADSGSVDRLPNRSVFTYGEQVFLVARPDTGFFFGGWGGDTTGTDTTISLTITRDLSVSANFVRIGSFGLIVVCAHGTVTRSPDEDSYLKGDTVTLGATPEPGYVFHSWSGDATGTSPTVAISMDTSKTVTANFIPRTYRLTLTDIAGGSISAEPAAPEYDSGTVVTLAAVADSGYRFVSWQGGVTGAVNPTTIVMHGERSVSASFTARYVLQLQVSPANAAIVSPLRDTVDSNESVQITCIPNAGYAFLGWTVTGGSAAVEDTSDAQTYVQTNSNAIVTAELLHFEPPVVGANPVGGAIHIGDTLSLEVTMASGTPPFVYQWYRNGQIMPGDTLSVLRIAGAQKSDSGSYYVRVSNRSLTVATSQTVDVPVVYVVKVAAGGRHTLFILNDGSLWACGSNSSGQLGDGTTTDALSPVEVGAMGKSVVDMAGGWEHSLFLKSDGTLWACGANGNGQLGNGQTTGSPDPVLVQGMSGSVSEVAAGGYHSVCVKSDGSLWTWGKNLDAQLGDSSTTDRPAPVRVWNMSSSVLSVAGGYRHTAILKTDGSVWACGTNQNFQIGDSTYATRRTPVQVYGLVTSVLSVTAGQSHSLALMFDGSLVAWGYNYNGQLGDSSTTSRRVPGHVVGMETGVAAVSAGENHTLIRKQDGTLWACGDNFDGQLGNSSTTSRNIAVWIESAGNDVVAIAAGSDHSVILKSNGTLWACGSNNAGQLGKGTRENSTVFVRAY